MPCQGEISHVESMQKLHCVGGSRHGHNFLANTQCGLDLQALHNAPRGLISNTNFYHSRRSPFSLPLLELTECRAQDHQR